MILAPNGFVYLYDPEQWEKVLRFCRNQPPAEPSLCWDVKVGWVPVQAIDPATGRCYVQGPAPTYEAPE